MESFETNKHCFIFDLDGTLANIEHRLHFIKREKPDWTMFNECCLNDRPIDEVIRMCRFLSDAHYIMVCTGRMGTESVKQKTVRWLNENRVPYTELMFRADRDYRPDHEVKKEMLDHIRKTYYVAGAFDDRDQVVDMWRANGVMTYQVARGAY